jgi:DNA-binding response OmpR family regulator
MMNASGKKRILIVEDEQHIADGLKLNLTLQGYEVVIAADGVKGLDLWKEWQPDLIVLDIMLPGIDGLSILRNIRLEDEKIPILILSARGGIDDKIKGLQYGVDDYLAKPFELEEFLLRIARLLKRIAMYESTTDVFEIATSSMDDDYVFGDIKINFVDSTFTRGQKIIQLTEQEVKLLKLFIKNKGKALPRKKLLEIGWGYTGNMTTRTVDNFIVRFRKYFEKNPKKPEFFKSRRSVGYIFDHDD